MDQLLAWQVEGQELARATDLRLQHEAMTQSFMMRLIRRVIISLGRTTPCKTAGAVK